MNIQNIQERRRHVVLVVTRLHHHHPRINKNRAQNWLVTVPKCWIFGSASHLFFLLFLFNSLSLVCSDAFFLKCRPRHDPLSSKKQPYHREREKRGVGNLGIPPTPIILPHTHDTTSTLCIGGNRQMEEEEERVWDSTFYPSFLKVEGVCIYVYVHMMRK